MLRGTRGDDPKGSGARSASLGVSLVAIRNRNGCDARVLFPSCSEDPKDVSAGKNLTPCTSSPRTCPSQGFLLTPSPSHGKPLLPVKLLKNKAQAGGRHIYLAWGSRALCKHKNRTKCQKSANTNKTYTTVWKERQRGVTSAFWSHWAPPQTHGKQTTQCMWVVRGRLSGTPGRS